VRAVNFPTALIRKLEGLVFRSFAATLLSMQVSEAVHCPFCGQANELLIDTTIPSQRFTTDCEVCCRPFEVATECEPGEIVQITVLE
jgi:hypothetical protein